MWTPEVLNLSGWRGDEQEGDVFEVDLSQGGYTEFRIMALNGDKVYVEEAHQ